MAIPNNLNSSPENQPRHSFPNYDSEVGSNLETSIDTDEKKENQVEIDSNKEKQIGIDEAKPVANIEFLNENKILPVESDREEVQAAEKKIEAIEDQGADTDSPGNTLKTMDNHQATSAYNLAAQVAWWQRDTKES